MEEITVSAVLGGVFGAVIMFVLGHFGLVARLGKLEAEIASIRNTGNANAGREKYREQKERMETAIADAMRLFQEGKTPEEILKEVGTKYPDVAADLARKHIFG